MNRGIESGQKWLILVALAWCLGSAQVRPDSNVVVPNDLGYAIEGDSSSAFPFFIEQGAVSSMRYQQVYDAGQFAMLDPGYRYIWAIFFRADGSVSNVGNWITNIQVNLSTTSRSVTNLSPVFSNNVGPDDSVVFGPRSLAVEGGGAGIPHGFSVWIALAKPFFYEPGAGNLLLDIRNFTGGPVPVKSVSTLDATTENVVSSARANTVSAEMGTVFTGGLVTGFATFPVPVRPALPTVVPNDLKIVDGDGAAGAPFFISPSLSSMRYQQAYDTSQFTAIGPEGGYITDIYFRGDASGGGGAFITSMQIELSTTSQSVSNLNPVFANNLGTNDTVVFNSGRFQLGAQLGSFDARIVLSKPFYYNPVAGNLLLDVRNFEGNPPPYQSVPHLDFTTERFLSSIYSTNVDTPLGNSLIGGLVTQFVIAPPPQLNVEIVTNSVALSWETQPPVFVLQASPGLNPATWQTVTNGIVGNDAYQTLVLSRDSLATNRCFRLLWPSGP